MFGALLSIQNYFLVEKCCKMVLSTIATFILKYNLTFKEILVFSFYLLGVEVNSRFQWGYSVFFYDV